VLPVAEETSAEGEEEEPLYDMKDIKLEVMRAGGAGGQVHIPPQSSSWAHHE
jgi:protein subunit release factor A